MVRLSDLPPEEAAHLLSKACDPFDTRPWVSGPPLSERRVSIITTAGLHRVGDSPFSAIDLICHVAYDQPPLTRRERAENVRKRNYFTRFGDQARAVINALLDKYADEGIVHIEDIGILNVSPLSDLGTPVEIIEAFGGREKYLEALLELEKQLYAA